jgi:hypothetical protein
LDAAVVASITWNLPTSRKGLKVALARESDTFVTEHFLVTFRFETFAVLPEREQLVDAWPRCCVMAVLGVW